MNTIRILGRSVALAGLAMFSACSFGPSPVRPPSVDASGAAALAIETYDTNGDGAIAGDELAKAPGINAAIKNLDSDGDGKVTADAIEERIEAWQANGTGLMALRCAVMMDGDPLKGATVTYDPEPFLGDEVKTAVGLTDRYAWRR